MVKLKEAFEDAIWAVTSGRRPEARFGIRLVPGCEIYNNNIQWLKEVQMELLALSVSATVRPRFIRIQGVQNCRIIAQFCDELWWLKCLELFEYKRHLTKEGIVEIMYIRDKREGARQQKHRVTFDEAVKTVMES